MIIAPLRALSNCLKKNQNQRYDIGVQMTAMVTLSRFPFGSIRLPSFSLSRRYHKYLIACGCGIIGASAFGLSAWGSTFETEVKKIDAISTALQGIITGITNAAVAPIGLAAAFGMFKMMILKAV